MTLEMLLFWIHLRQDILVSEDEIWWSSHGPDRRLLRAFRRHKKGLKLLIAWSSKDVCPAKDLHRNSWNYCGNGNYTCGACVRLIKEVS